MATAGVMAQPPFASSTVVIQRPARPGGSSFLVIATLLASSIAVGLFSLVPSIGFSMWTVQKCTTAAGVEVDAIWGPSLIGLRSKLPVFGETTIGVPACQDLHSGSKPGTAGAAIIQMVCSLSGIDCNTYLGCEVTRPARIAGAGGTFFLFLGFVAACCSRAGACGAHTIGGVFGTLGGALSAASAVYFYVQTREGSGFGLPSPACSTSFSFGGFVSGGIGAIALCCALSVLCGRGRKTGRLGAGQEPLMSVPYGHAVP